jgi:hypothetical protein
MFQAVGDNARAAAASPLDPARRSASSSRRLPRASAAALSPSGFADRRARPTSTPPCCARSAASALLVADEAPGPAEAGQPARRPCRDRAALLPSRPPAQQLQTAGVKGATGLGRDQLIAHLRSVALGVLEGRV